MPHIPAADAGVPCQGLGRFAPLCKPLVYQGEFLFKKLDLLLVVILLVIAYRKFGVLAPYL